VICVFFCVFFVKNTQITGTCLYPVCHSVRETSATLTVVSRTHTCFTHCARLVSPAQRTLDEEAGRALRSSSNQSSEPYEVAQYLQQKRTYVAHVSLTQRTYVAHVSRDMCVRTWHISHSRSVRTWHMSNETCAYVRGTCLTHAAYVRGTCLTRHVRTYVAHVSLTQRTYVAHVSRDMCVRTWHMSRSRSSPYMGHFLSDSNFRSHVSLILTEARMSYILSNKNTHNTQINLNKQKLGEP